MTIALIFSSAKGVAGIMFNPSHNFRYEVPEYDLLKCLDSGQMFRYKPVEGNSYYVQSLDKECIVHQDGNSILISTDSDASQSYWREYFALDEDLAPLYSMQHKHKFIREAIEYSKGLHLLRQDPWECLISFICSQQKAIPQIKLAVESIASRVGTRLESGNFAFPRPDQITVGSLEGLKLGYRERYIYSAAISVQKYGFDVYKYTSDRVSYDTAMVNLLSLTGVGVKVANCVALFSLGFKNAFPIDTHIEKVLDLLNAECSFNYRDYGEYAGILQQYLFRYALYNGL